MNNTDLVSIKLVSGEEIVCQVVDVVDSSYRSIIIRDPLKVEYKQQRRNEDIKYNLVPWILFTNTREFEINATKILGVSKIEDKELLERYLAQFRKLIEPAEDLKELLERIYRDYDAEKTLE